MVYFFRVPEGCWHSENPASDVSIRGCGLGCQVKKRLLDESTRLARVGWGVVDCPGVG